MSPIYIWCDIQDYIPNENTLVYYPLDTENTVNDLSGHNYTLTKTGNVSFWTYQWVDCAWFTSNWGSSWECWMYRSSDTIIAPQSTDLTFHVWLYKWSESMYYNPRIIWKYWSSWAVFTYASCNRISTWDSTSYWVIPDNDAWFLFSCAYKYSDKTWAYYKNWTYVDTQTNSGPSWNSNSWIILWTRDNLWTGYWDKWSGAMSRVIIENRLWNATDISNYYNLTKWNYWL